MIARLNSPLERMEQTRMEASKGKMRRAACMLLLACASAQEGVFISPNGSDTTGDGSFQHPFATITRAQTLVRSMIPNQSADIVVYLRGGEYVVQDTIVFAPADGGNPQGPYYVHYKSYPGDANPAVLHGGVPVVGWQLVNATSQLWSAHMPVDTRQMYVNGQRANRTFLAGGLDGMVNLTEWGYITNDTRPLAWAATQNAGDIEFLYTGVGSPWTECRCRVESVAPLPNGAGANITMKQPCFTLGVNRPFGQGITKPANIENVFMELSTPGTYYYNSQTSTAYYVARPQDDMKTALVIAASTELLMLIQGERDAPTAYRTRFLRFENLLFEYAGWLAPSTGLGYIDLQSGYRFVQNDSLPDTSWPPVPANIQVNAGWNISFINCTFQHLGGTGLSIDDGSQSVVVVNSTFADISAGSVRIGSFDNLTDPLRYDAYSVITQNLFIGGPMEYRDCSVVTTGWTFQIEITQNSILGAPYSGMSIGWGWARDNGTSAGARIIGNFIDSVMSLLTDGGAIYLLGPQPGTVVSRNYVRNQIHPYGSLYPDEGSAYMFIQDNVVDGGYEWLHIWTSSIHDIVVQDCWTNQNYSVVVGTNITLINNQYVLPGQPFPPAAQQIMDAAGVPGVPKPPPVGRPPQHEMLPLAGGLQRSRKCRFCERYA